MNKIFNIKKLYFIPVFILFSLILFANNVQAKDIWYKGQILETGEFQYTTHVKSAYTKPQKYTILNSTLKNRNYSSVNTSEGYQTKYISFHFNYGSNYWRNDNEAYWHDSSAGQFVYNSQEYVDKTWGVRVGLDNWPGINSDNYVLPNYFNQLWNTWYESNGQYANKLGHSIQYSEERIRRSDGNIYADATFILPAASFNKMIENATLKSNIEAEKKIKNELGTSGEKDTYYVRFSHLLITKLNGTEHLLRTSGDFINVRKWTNPNYGWSDNKMDYNKGASGINNYDNIISFKHKTTHDREVYVGYAYIDANGVEHSFDSPRSTDNQPKFQNLVDSNGGYIGPLYQNGNLSSIEGTEWSEAYIIQSDENLHVCPRNDSNIVDINGKKYELFRADMNQGMAWDKTAPISINNSNIWNTIIKEDETNSTDYTNIKFIYKPVEEAGKREAYVKHIDYNTGKDLGNVGEQLLPTNLADSITTRGGFSSAYSFSTKRAMTIMSKTTTKVNGVNYRVKGAKAVTYQDDNSSLSLTNSKLSQISINTVYGYKKDLTKISSSGSNYQVSFSSTQGQSDITGIIFYYEKSNFSLENELEDLEILGKLDFINHSTSYIKSTDQTNEKFDKTIADYIPSSETLDPYIEGAYPYIVRALNYEAKTRKSDDEYRIKLKQPFEYISVNSETGESKKISGSVEKPFKYKVNVNLKYYGLNNFKMYRISNMKINNPSDKLFDQGEQTIGMSSKYEDNFRGKNTGYNKSILEVRMSAESNIITLPTVIGRSADAREKLDEYSDSRVASLAELKVNYEYSNDFIVLDGKEDMLVKNYTSSENSVFDLTTNIDVDTTNCKYTDNLNSYMKPSSDKRTTYADFSGTINIPENIDNGVRLATGSINYTLCTGNFNVGRNDFSSKDYTYTINSSKTVNINSNHLSDQSKVLEGEDLVRKVNVFTPMRLVSDSKIMKTENSTNHTIGDTKQVVLQKGVEFTVEPKAEGYNSAGYSILSTDKFIDYYYVMCDFDIGNVKANGSNIADKNAYNAVKIQKDKTLVAIPKSIEDESSVSQIANHVYVFAISKNMPANLRNYMDRLFTNGIYNFRLEDVSSWNLKNTYIDNGSSDQNNQITKEDKQSTNNMLSAIRYGAANHIIRRDITTTNIGRIYDFAITDCTDLAFKDAFKRSDNNDVNKNTKVTYYSGTRRWIVSSYGNTMYSTGVNTRIPLGPYKYVNAVTSDKSYIFAPKLGYRISYDLKTTGYVKNSNENNDRYIVIYPRYYFIGKSGDRYEKDIDLYYKDANGKYKQLTTYTQQSIGSYDVKSGSEYNIYFKPNDPYRYLRGTYIDNSNMSGVLEKLSISSASAQAQVINHNYSSNKSPIVLGKNMMGLDSGAFIQSWYGEFKLPNSTIAVKKNGNVNDPLTNGYIGVIFDIYCVDKTDNGNRVLSYSSPDKTKGDNSDNTSQWDYEGFLGFELNNCGSPLVNKLSLQLEKGTWGIDNTRYNDIKGTVLLYDADSRAANDFN